MNSDSSLTCPIANACFCFTGMCYIAINAMHMDFKLDMSFYVCISCCGI
jgi:hypothetical protein